MNHLCLSPSLPAPCAPQAVENNLSVFWAVGRSAGLPEDCHVTVQSRDGSVLTCNTTDSDCEVSGLQCGQEYSVTVRAVTSTCQGPSSSPRVVHTGRSIFRFSIAKSLI